jgi:hypothetical protein
MEDIVCTVTLWLAWYREREEPEQPRRLLRLKMLHASSREEACAEMSCWLERRGLRARDLERLEPSPYGLRFQALKATAL